MALSVTDMIQALLGVKTYQVINPVTASVGVAQTLIARGKPQRAFLLIVNLSANVVYVSPDNLVSATHGIRLAPGGGTVSMIWDRDLELVALPWSALASAAASDIFVLESVID